MALVSPVNLFLKVCQDLHLRDFLASAAVALGWILDQDRALVLPESTQRELSDAIVVRGRPLVVAVTAKRVAALRVEVVELRRGRKSVRLGGTLARHRDDATVAVVGGTREHLALHLIDILLRVFNQLDRLVPLLLERGLRLLDLLLLHPDPAVNLLLLELESSRGDLLVFEKLLDVAALLLLLVLQHVFAELNQL